MKYKFNLRGRDPVTVEIGFWTVTEWERVNDRSLRDLETVRDRLWLAWHEARFGKISVPDKFDDFVQQLETFEPVSEEPERPTDAAPTAAS